MFTTTLDAMRNWRPHLVQNIPGEVLEIGVGSGANLGLYRRATHVWGIEPDAEAAAAAARAAATAVVPVDVRVAPAEALPFDDHSFDHVVSSLVFCSVTDPPQALAEIERVLRPGGVLHMLEHVRPGFAPLGWLAAAVTPAWSRMAGNCHLDRRTVELLRDQGWRVQVRRRIGIFVRLDATKP
jgi:ubiquinone/menaquinone biosynthesis C-methylase UbiE